MVRQIGYVIPAPIIRRFLDAVAEGTPVGFCALGARCQSVENGQLRRFLRVPADVSGVLVNALTPLTHAAAALRKDDLLTHLDGRPIANDGTVALRGQERVAFDYLVSLKRPGDSAQLRLLRGGQAMELAVTLAPLPSLVPVHMYDRRPSFYVFAGLVFAPLTQPHLHESGDDWYNSAPRKLVDRALNAQMKAPGQQIVILSQARLRRRCAATAAEVGSWRRALEAARPARCWSTRSTRGTRRWRIWRHAPHSLRGAQGRCGQRCASSRLLCRCVPWTGLRCGTCGTCGTWLRAQPASLFASTSMRTACWYWSATQRRCSRV